MIYAKTETGQRVIKDRSVPLTPRQRSAFILFDGKRTVDGVLAATAGMGVTAEDIQFMADSGLLAVVEGAAAAAPARPPAVAPVAAPEQAAAPAVVRSSRTDQERYQDAYPIATALTANMGLRGFRLNLAVEGAGSYEKLLELSPKIREAVGDEKFARLDRALNS